MVMITEHLPPFVLAELYPHSLVILEPEQPKQPEQQSVEAPIIKLQEELPKLKKEKTGFSFLGNNAQKICIVVEDHIAVYLADMDLQFLTNVLSACKLNIGDVAIINLAQSEVSINTIKEQLMPTVCLLFGMDADAIGLPFKIPAYQQQAYAGCTFLVLPNFDRFAGTAEAAKLEKTKLWVSLKKLLNM
jgi:hypothetical protein